MKYGNWAILLFFSLVIGTALWWFTPRRVVNECDELRKDLVTLQNEISKADQKIYKFEHPEEHTVHFGKLGVRTLAEGRGSILFNLFPDGEHYRYPLQLACGCGPCTCDEPTYLAVGREYSTNITNQTVEVRPLQKNYNYYELIRVIPDSTLIVDQ